MVRYAQDGRKHGDLLIIMVLLMGRYYNNQLPISKVSISSGWGSVLDDGDESSHIMGIYLFFDWFGVSGGGYMCLNFLFGPGHRDTDFEVEHIAQKFELDRSLIPLGSNDGL